MVRPAAHYSSAILYDQHFIVSQFLPVSYLLSEIIFVGLKMTQHIRHSDITRDLSVLKYVHRVV